MRSGLIGTVAGVTALAIAGMAAAQDKPATGRDETNTVIAFATYAERVVRHDRLRATLRAEASDADPVRVQGEINKKMARALERVRRTNAVKAETGSYSIYQITDKNRAVSWRGSQSISVYATDFESVLGVIRDLQSGGLVMSGMGFEVTPELRRKMEQEVEAEAVGKAVERSRSLAAAAQSTVVRIRTLRIGDTPAHRPLPMAKAMESDQMMSAAPMPPPVGEAGEETIRVSVEVDVLVATLR
jgi:predicted secreted protein